MSERLKELVNNSEFSQIQKNMMIGFISRANEDQEKKSNDRKLIEEIANEKRFSEVIISTDEIKIYTVSGHGEWEIKYPFRSIYLDKNGVWSRTNTVSPNLDIAYLIVLQCKHLGLNSEFVGFAMKMLEMPVIE